MKIRSVDTKEKKKIEKVQVIEIHIYFTWMDKNFVIQNLFFQFIKLINKLIILVARNICKFDFTFIDNVRFALKFVLINLNLAE